MKVGDLANASELKIGDLVEQDAKLHGLGVVINDPKPPTTFRVVSSKYKVVNVHFFACGESWLEYVDELNLISRPDSA